MRARSSLPVMPAADGSLAADGVVPPAIPSFSPLLARGARATRRRIVTLLAGEGQASRGAPAAIATQFRRELGGLRFDSVSGRSREPHRTVTRKNFDYNARPRGRD